MMMAKQEKGQALSRVAQERNVQALFHVYEDEVFLGKRPFVEGSLSIGSGRKADILLNHQSVEDIHAVVFMDGSQFVLNNNFPNDGLRVNGLMVEKVPLKTRDIIHIGPYDIHVEIEAPQDGALVDATARMQQDFSENESQKLIEPEKPVVPDPQAGCSLVL
ncbi:MAG: FHA domain-containing protein, partial [Desulfosarcinaceae bacterium]